MAAAGVVRKEKKRKRNRDDEDFAIARNSVASGVAAAVPVAAAPAAGQAKDAEEATGTKQKEKNKEKKKKQKKEKKSKRTMAQAQEDGGSGADPYGAEDRPSRVAAAAAADGAGGVRNSTTSTVMGRTIIDGPDRSEADLVPVNEAKQEEKPAKRRRKGKRAPSAASPSAALPLAASRSSASPLAASLAASALTAKPLAEPAPGAPSLRVGAASLPALLCTGKVDEYPPISSERATRKSISSEQSARNGAGDRHGKSSSRGSRTSAKKVKGRRSRSLPRRTGDEPDGSDDLRGASESKHDDSIDKDNLNHNHDDLEDDPPEGVNDDNELEDNPLEGVMHDGAMFLVDARRRVFSAQRDERGDLVKVGHFDDDRGEVFLDTRLQTTNGNTAEALPEARVTTSGAAAEALSTPPTSADLDTGAASEALQGGRIAGGSGATVVDGPETEAAGGGKKKKKKKKGKTRAGIAGEDGAEAGYSKESASGGKVPEAGPRDVVEYPFEVEECDHCETSELAYTHIAPFLAALAVELGKTPEELVIYDPYFCQGSTVRRLASLGFPRVYNKNEDFYQAVKSGTVPEYDVLVTNPPFSGEHVPKILSFCARQGAKPWLLLMPNYVYLKDYYEPSLRCGPSRVAALPFYLTPPKRYMYYSPQGSRVNVKSSERKTSPFNTFWYIRLGDGDVTSRILQAYDARSRKLEDEPKCCVARTTQQIPYKMMDSNDPRRKKARDRLRSIDRIRKKKSEWTVS